MKLFGGIGDIVKGVTDIADDLHTSDEERLQIDSDLRKGQMAVNAVEAKHASLFVAGWRPATGWVCVVGLGYHFLLTPLLLWVWTICQAKGWLPADTAPPPSLDIGPLMTLMTGMLGLGALRGWEKLKGVAR